MAVQAVSPPEAAAAASQEQPVHSSSAATPSAAPAVLDTMLPGPPAIAAPGTADGTAAEVAVASGGALAPAATAAQAAEALNPGAVAASAASEGGGAAPAQAGAAATPVAASATGKADEWERTEVPKSWIPVPLVEVRCFGPQQSCTVCRQTCSQLAVLSRHDTSIPRAVTACALSAWQSLVARCAQMRVPVGCTVAEIRAAVSPTLSERGLKVTTVHLDHGQAAGNRVPALVRLQPPSLPWRRPKGAPVTEADGGASASATSVAERALRALSEAKVALRGERAILQAGYRQCASASAACAPRAYRNKMAVTEHE